MNKRYELHVCMGSSCFSRGNKELVVLIKEYLKKNHLDDKVVLRGARCLGHCTNGPNMVINGDVIEKVNPLDIDAMLDKEFGNLR